MFKLQKSDKGVCAFATRDIQAGTVIVDDEEPSVYCLSPNVSGAFCANCMFHKEANPRSTRLFRCTLCKYTCYCSAECQKEDWEKYHRVECRLIPKIRIKSPWICYLIRALISCITNTNGLFTPEACWQLEGHVKKRFEVDENGEGLILTRALQFASELVAEHLPLKDKFVRAKDLLQLVGVLATNTFTVYDHNLDECGMALYLPNLSRFNHSCAPNATFINAGRVASICANREIKEGEEITVSYVDPLMPRWLRRDRLKNMYSFDCDCQRCLPLDSIDPLNSFQCPNSQCKGYWAPPESAMPQIMKAVKEESSTSKLKEFNIECPECRSIIFNCNQTVANEYAKARKIRKTCRGKQLFDKYKAAVTKPNATPDDIVAVFMPALQLHAHLLSIMHPLNVEILKSGHTLRGQFAGQGMWPEAADIESRAIHSITEILGDSALYFPQTSVRYRSLARILHLKREEMGAGVDEETIKEIREAEEKALKMFQIVYRNYGKEFINKVL